MASNMAECEDYVGIITADKKWEEQLRKDLKDKYTGTIKSLCDGSIGELKAENLRNLMKARKVIVGFSEDQKDLESYTAYSVLTEMLEQNELDSKKLVPVKITTNSVIPEVCNEFIPGNAYEGDFIDKLVETLDGAKNGKKRKSKESMFFIITVLLKNVIILMFK
ncbi:uncharacterized protein LOC117116248 isoform X2 [Anneissia japonica]|uniref:uncharacterized protein LOC117116248 isoform X2 n=1 Tax=Anneissia japonica TaxID=1529436 RepID=UPI0014257283|nr:uncharacterized protein LOC117116248 isoform X2 [Anneissia japonica]XP_033116139.1 uncharacterized protein LOC117116248 isoform X2 [Anneissia japonica]